MNDSANPVSDLLLFIGLSVGLFILWVITGGPDRARTDADRTPQSEIRNERPSRSGGVAGSRPERSDIKQELEELRLSGQASPYEGMVRIGSSRPRERIAQFEYITLRASSGNETSIPITGWKLESVVTGSFGFIPQAIPLPFPGKVNATLPLRLSPGGEAVMVSGRSPNGLSFRINTCTGYFQQYQTYTPRLPERCPNPENEFETFSTLPKTNVRDDDFDQCRQYIDRNVRRCEIDTTNLNARDREGNFLIEPPLVGSCQTFIKEELTYSGCVANHRNDKDFFKDEWRVYMGSFAELWREESDIIRLLDGQGKTVDIFSYD